MHSFSAVLYVTHHVYRTNISHTGLLLLCAAQENHFTQQNTLSCAAEMHDLCEVA